jgi:hypothetical protein
MLLNTLIESIYKIKYLHTLSKMTGLKTIAKKPYNRIYYAVMVTKSLITSIFDLPDNVQAYQVLLLCFPTS